MKYFSLTTRIAMLAAALFFWLSPAALHAQAVTSSSIQRHSPEPCSCR